MNATAERKYKVRRIKGHLLNVSFGWFEFFNQVGKCSVFKILKGSYEDEEDTSIPKPGT